MAFVLLLLLGAAALSLIVRRVSATEGRFMYWGYGATVVAAVAQVLVTTHFFGGGDQDAYFLHAQQHSHRMALNFDGYAPEVLKLALRDSTTLAGSFAGTTTGAMEGLTALAVFVVGDSIYATCLLFALLSFFARVAFFFGLKRHMNNSARRSCLLACLATPSVVFWTSGIVKESIAMTGLGLAVLGASAVGARRLSGVLVLLLGAFIAYLTKPYVLAALAVTLPAWYFVVRARARTRGVRPRNLLLAVAAAAGGAVLIGEVVPDFAIDQLADSMNSLQTVGQRVQGGTNYSLGTGGASMAAQIALAPLGLLSSLFRPLPLEISNAMVLVSSVEITGLAGLLFIALFRAGPRQLLAWLMRDETLFAAAAFVLVFGTAVGLASTNLGSLARYRVPMMPFWVLLVLEFRRRSSASRLRRHQAVAGAPGPPPYDSDRREGPPLSALRTLPSRVECAAQNV